MNASPSSRNAFKHAFLAGTLGMLLLFMTTGAGAGNAPESDTSKADNVIHVTSDRLYSDSKTRWAEFVGNVRASQGNTVITADRLKIYYKSALSTAASKGPGEESIQRLESSGNVVIRFDNRVAKADKAVYITDSRILILTGPNASITSGKNTISGEKITFYRKDGRIRVEGGKKGRVEAFFYQKEKGLN